jgi:hypothetical protein
LGDGRQEAECRRDHREPVAGQRTGRLPGTSKRGLGTGNPVQQMQNQAEWLR